MMSRSLSRRGFLRLAGTTATGGALSACSPGWTTRTRLDESKAQLVYQDWRTEWFPPMARVNRLQPARASLIEDWVRFIHEEFPEEANEADIAAFAEGHLEGYSVTAEVFPNMVGARRLTDAAWDEIFTLGQASVDTMETVCRQTEEVQ